MGANILATSLHSDLVVGEYLAKIFTAREKDVALFSALEPLPTPAEQSKLREITDYITNMRKMMIATADPTAAEYLFSDLCPSASNQDPSLLAARPTRSKTTRKKKRLWSMLLARRTTCMRPSARGMAGCFQRATPRRRRRGGDPRRATGSGHCSCPSGPGRSKSRPTFRQRHTGARRSA